MTRLPATVISRDCGDASRPSSLYRPASRRPASPAASSSPHPYMSPSSRSSGPVHDHLAAVTGGGGGERGLVLAGIEPVGDDAGDVEARLDQHTHRVPCLEHLAAVDALE